MYLLHTREGGLIAIFYRSTGYAATHQQRHIHHLLAPPCRFAAFRRGQFEYRELLYGKPVFESDIHSQLPDSAYPPLGDLMILTLLAMMQQPRFFLGKTRSYSQRSANQQASMLVINAPTLVPFGHSTHP